MISLYSCSLCGADVGPEGSNHRTESECVTVANQLISRLDATVKSLAGRVDALERAANKERRGSWRRLLGGGE